MRIRRRASSAGADARNCALRWMAVTLMLSAACLSLAASRSSAAEPKDLPLSTSAAVALAQTGPNGTLMSVGCEYSFNRGPRKPKAHYVLVVKNGKGKIATVAVKLEDQGMAGVLIDGWRPDDRPFTGYFAEQVAESHRQSKSEFRPISAEIEFPLNQE